MKDLKEVSLLRNRIEDIKAKGFNMQTQLDTNQNQPSVYAGLTAVDFSKIKVGEKTL